MMPGMIMSAKVHEWTRSVALRRRRVEETPLRKRNKNSKKKKKTAMGRVKKSTIAARANLKRAREVYMGSLGSSKKENVCILV
jgi:hypothetical protein